MSSVQKLKSYEHCTSIEVVLLGHRIIHFHWYELLPLSPALRQHVPLDMCALVV